MLYLGIKANSGEVALWYRPAQDTKVFLLESELNEAYYLSDKTWVDISLHNTHMKDESDFLHLVSFR